MRRGWLPGLVLAAGCGRFGFGGSPGGDAPADDDASDATLDDGADLDAFTICHRGAWSMPQPITIDTSTWAPPVEIPELVSQVTAATSGGGPELSPDGRTLYLFLNVGSIDIYVATRSCD